MDTRTNAIAVTLFGGLVLGGAANAAPLTVSYGDLPNCDPMIFGPPVLDELGTSAIFPAGCLIFADSLPTTDSACPTSDDPTIANANVRMINLSGRSFSDLWYVAENGSGHSNFDGIINGAEAFKIDAIGGNRPLIGESITANGIFEPGEAWTFIIDDFTNFFGFLPEDFVSIGVPSGAPGSGSSGSIVALEVPTPGAVGLAALGGLAALRRRRRLA